MNEINKITNSDDISDELMNELFDLTEKGNYNNVIDKCMKLLSKYKNSFKIFSILGNTFYNCKDYQKAILYYEKAKKINNTIGSIYYNTGISYYKIDDYSNAIKNWKSSINLNFYLDKSLYNIALCYTKLGDLESSINFYKKHLLANPNNYKALNNLANQYQIKGDFETSIYYYNKSIELNDAYTPAHRNLSLVQKYTNGNKHFQKLIQLYHQKDLSTDDQINLCFALGKAYEDIKDYLTSFKYYDNGNSLVKKYMNYDISNDENLFHIIKLHNSRIKKNLEEFKNQENHLTPIFIVGMPRSGTTLVEQIISNHSKVKGFGELTFLLDGITKHSILEKNIKNPEQNNLNLVNEYYLSKINIFEDDITHFTDKLPLNFRWIGIILNCFRNAKIINVKRNEIATCWSIYKHYFTHKDGNKFSYDLSDIGNYYNLYKNLMEFWNLNYPNKIYTLEYENLINNKDEEIKNMLNFCELDWENSCKEFHKNKRVVHTASSTQVRKKIYNGSSEKWKNYKPYLKDLLIQLSN